MQSKETLIVLRMQDEVTRQMNLIAGDVKKHLKDISQSYVTTSGTIGQHGKQVTNLTEWIKEQRMEGRQHSFVFNQMKEVITSGSVALALFANTAGNSSNEMKKLSDAANKGFITFQGLENVFGFLPGPTGIVAGVMGGLAVTMLELKDNTTAVEEAQKRLKGVLQNFNEGISLAETIREYDVLTQVVTSSEQNEKKLLQERQAIMAEVQDKRKAGIVITDAETEAYTLRLKSIASEIESEKKRRAAFSETTKALKEQKEQLEQIEIVRKRQEGERQQALLNSIVVTTLKQADAVADLGKYFLVAESGSGKFYANTKKDSENMMEDLNKAAAEIRRNIAANISLSKQQKKNYEAEVESYAQAAQIFSTSLTTALSATFAGGEAIGNNFFKSMLTGYIDMVQGMINAGLGAAIVNSIISWNPLQLVRDMAKLAAATTALQAAKAMVGRFEYGTPYGGFMVPGGYSNDKYPMMVSSGERVTVETQQQQRASKKSGPVTVNVHINAPGTPVEMVRKAIVEGLRQTGLTIDKYAVDTRSQIVIA